MIYMGDASHHSQTYTDYLASPEWQAKRQEVFALRGRRCESCGSRHQITVHHITYARLGYEALDDLQVLCWPCHEKLERQKKKKIDPPIEATPVRRGKRIATGAPMPAALILKRRQQYKESLAMIEQAKRTYLEANTEAARAETKRHAAQLKAQKKRAAKEQTGDARLKQLARLMSKPCK